MSEAGDAVSGELGGFGFSLRRALSRDLETAGKQVFVIGEIDRGGPAYASGLRVDDVIEKVDGQHILSWVDAARLLLAPAESWSQVIVPEIPSSLRLIPRYAVSFGLYLRHDFLWRIAQMTMGSDPPFLAQHAPQQREHFRASKGRSDNLCPDR